MAVNTKNFCTTPLLEPQAANTDGPGSLSGKAVLWLNGSKKQRGRLNPDDLGLSILYGVPRLIAGVVAGCFGGVAGTIYNVGKTLISIYKWDWSLTKKNFRACLADLFRACTLGLATGLVYMAKPDLYFSENERTSEQWHPVSAELCTVGGFLAIILDMLFFEGKFTDCLSNVGGKKSEGKKPTL